MGIQGHPYLASVLLPHPNWDICWDPDIHVTYKGMNTDHHHRHHTIRVFPATSSSSFLYSYRPNRTHSVPTKKPKRTPVPLTWTYSGRQQTG